MLSGAEEMKRDPSATESIIDEIMASSSAVLERFQPDEQAIKQCMAQITADPLTLELIEESTHTILCVLQEIGRSEPVNGITIAKQAKIPKGTVSKMTRRLLAKGLIGKQTLPHNKKEILFRLTPPGRELYLTHQVIVQAIEKEVIQFLKRYEADELRFMVRFLHDILETSFLPTALHSETARNNRRQSPRATEKERDESL